MKRYVLNHLLILFIGVLSLWLFLLLDIELLSVSICFIIPIAGLAYGMLTGWLLSSALKKENIAYSQRYAFEAAVFSVALLAFLTWVDYATCFVTDEYLINHYFKGNHISWFSIDGTPVSFWYYFRMTFIESMTEISMRGNRSNPIETGIKGISIIIYAVNYILAAVSAWRVMAHLKNARVCENCKKYYTEKLIDRFEGISEGEKCVSFVVSQINNGTSYVPRKIKSQDYSFAIKVEYCPECKSGFVNLYKCIKGNRGNTEKYMNSYSVSPEQVELLVGKSAQQENYDNKLRFHQVERINNEKASVGDNGEKHVDDAMVQELRNLKGLYDEGILTEEEYVEKKKHILQG